MNRTSSSQRKSSGSRRSNYDLRTVNDPRYHSTDRLANKYDALASEVSDHVPSPSS